MGHSRGRSEIKVRHHLHLLLSKHCTSHSCIPSSEIEEQERKKRHNKKGKLERKIPAKRWLDPVSYDAILRALSLSKLLSPKLERLIRV
ncbi:hypothetical protein CDAR_409881 [Caerostris darwini]|uniref:Uncharacterized protein n=1 Tax=Caerostris darwini TaxID=1538125 RepID=A0AAV4SED1_9ARAC|nr:hypothetical protein CDAR_409881 [Caerostris darwini]